MPQQFARGVARQLVDEVDLAGHLVARETISDELTHLTLGDPGPRGTHDVGGERLAEARREQQISVLEIAKELHLDESKVRALERNEFDVLGAPVFAKGHLRKYAELVGVPIEDVLTDYYQLNRSTGAPPVVGPTRTQPSDVKVGPWIAIVVAVVILGAGVWWFLMN